jgi:hypothetical protein
MEARGKRMVSQEAMGGESGACSTSSQSAVEHSGSKTPLHTSQKASGRKPGAPGNWPTGAEAATAPATK